MSQKKDRMEELVDVLNKASQAYYSQDREIISNYEYDVLYDELVRLEEETGMILAGSPTVSVGYEALEELPKEAHSTPMLSLDKTKDVEVLRGFIGTHKSLMSWKMDGLTIVLTYRDGKMEKAVTRGNGVIGEVITANAQTFINLPYQIPYKGQLVIRGEAIITYSDFEKINEEIEDVDAKYKNPRNLCSGSVRQLNSQITAQRKVRFYAFALVSAENVDFHNSRQSQMQWLTEQGFQVVEYRVVTEETLDEAMEYFALEVTRNDFPSDGLVVTYDDIAYGESLGSTAKFPRNSFAFKWADEIKTTNLLEIEWSASRTGLINPVAVFQPVELEGTTVSRASVHNISIVKDLKLGIGDELEVYKANMIIPQIARNLTGSGNIHIPEHCPVCDGSTKIRQENDVESLYCINPQCPAKKIKAFALFASRDAMNIEGLSQATLEKFIEKGFVKDFGDIYELSRYEDEIVVMEGFGRKSYDNLMENIEKSRHTTLPRVLFSLGILNVGLSNAKVICRAFDYDFYRIRNASQEEIAQVDGIGPVIAASVREYFDNPTNNQVVDHLLKYIVLEEVERVDNQTFRGMNFVITGSVNHFSNRAEVKELVESLGGKVTGTVTSKTNYLINNDVASNSSKNRKAKELGVAIITEEQFMDMY